MKVIFFVDLLTVSVTGLSIWTVPSAVALLLGKFTYHDGGYENRLTFLKKPLSEMISGPLSEHPATLMMSEDMKASVAGDLIAAFGVPISVLYLPEEMPSYADVDRNVTGDLGESSLRDFRSDNDTHNSSCCPVQTSLAVIILPVDVSAWWPLWKPLDYWRMESILLVSSTSCGASVHLKTTPLLEQTSFVSLLCSNTQGGRMRLPESAKLMTWLPFSVQDQSVHLGDWNSNSFRRWNDLFIDRFSDMSLKNVSIYAVQDDTPLVYKTANGSPRGLNVEIVTSLGKWLGFQLTLDLTSGETWEALGELVKKGKRDVMINFSANTPDRYRDFDLTVAYHHEGFGLVLEVPRPLPRWQNLLLPFTWVVWIFIMATFLISSVVYYLLYYQFDKSIIDNFLIVAKYLLTEPSGDASTPWMIRNFLLSCWIFSWIVQMCWIGNLIAVLTIPVFPKKIQTKEELAKSNYRLCMLDYGEFVPEALRTSTESTLATLGSKLDLVPLMMEWKEFGHEGCVNRVVAGTHAQTETYSYIKLVYARMGYASKTYMLKDELYPSYLSFRLKKHTPWKYKFDYGIQRLYETGLIQLWLQEAMEDFTDKSAEVEPSAEQEPLTLDHLQGSFFILGVGLFIALLIMGAEVLSPRRK